MTDNPIKELRRAGVPLAGWETADPAETIRSICAGLNGKANDLPIMAWDAIRALVGLNELGKGLVGEIAPEGPIQTGNLAECLALMQKAPEGSILFVHGLGRYLENPSVIQACWNLRDSWKANGSILIGLSPSFTLPAELAQDMVIISEALPGKAELGAIVESICKDAGVAKPDAATLDTITDTLLGLSAFAAEQTLARSVSKEGIDTGKLWDRKRRMIEQTPGLQVWQGGETFEDIAGLQNAKDYLQAILTSGNTPTRAVVFIDEIEKSLAGAAGDTSGTSQDQLGAILRFMQDFNVPGIILLGHPGTGKSALAKASGKLAKCPVIAFDFGAMKGSLVGESERKIRQALEIVRAISSGKMIFIATCNKLAALPPELKRRFSLGTFFMDLPTKEEQGAIWPLYIGKYGLKEQSLPACEGWTGAEIKACCEVAFRTGLPLKEAAAFIVPVCKSGADTVEQLRKMASGKFISASYKGPYRYAETQAPTGRKMEV